jgi:hypothetical protein
VIIETPPEIDAMPDGLPDKARQAFLLSQLGRLRHAGIPEPLGVSPRTLKDYMLCATTDCLRIARRPPCRSTAPGGGMIRAARFWRGTAKDRQCCFEWRNAAPDVTQA